MRAITRSRRRQEQPAPQQLGRQYLTFALAGETFAIPISTIKEILEYRDPTGVPMMPPLVRGVINLRGKVVPLLDLAARFYGKPAETTRRTCFVILEVVRGDVRQDVGIVVDSVSAVVDILDADVEASPDFGCNLRADFISGMGRVGERFVVLLDVERMLSGNELTQLHELGLQPAVPEPETEAGA